MKKIKELIYSLWHVLRLPEMQVLPGNLAFFLILSLAPIISLFGLIASSLHISLEGGIVGNVLPTGVSEILLQFVSGSSFKTSNILFIIIGFYVASNGADSLIIASNTLYKTKSKNYLARKIKAFFMTFFLLIFFVVVLLFMAFGSFILNKILSFGVIGKFIASNYIIINLVKILLVFLICFITIKIIYAMAPDIPIKSKYVNRGAFLATVSIMLVTGIYSFYITNFAHYDIIYGSLANIAILMLLTYFISYIIVLGIAINHSYYKIDEDTNNIKK